MFEQHTTAESRIIQWRKLRQNAETEQDVLDPFAQDKNPIRYPDYWTPKSGPNPICYSRRRLLLCHRNCYSFVPNIRAFKIP